MSQAASWMFTINNPTETPEEFLERIKDWTHLVYLVFQEERGENGTLHYQGYCELDRDYRFARLKQLDSRALS